MPPRRSTRNTQPSTADAALDQPLAVASSSTPKPTKKAKTVASRKRAAADESDQEEVKKPAKKKTKKDTKDKVENVQDAQDDADIDDGDDKEEQVVKKPAAKRGRKATKAKVEDVPDAEDDTAMDADDKEEEEEEEEDDSNMVTVLKRGAAPVDPTCVLVASHQVYSSDNEVWDAMLNQTNIQNNNNKFYVVQILHPVGNTNSCQVFTRWGRVGERGQSALTGAMGGVAAIAAFKKTFKSKAATDWENRHNMVARSGKYTWIERSFEEPKPVKKAADKEEVIIPDSKLEAAVQTFCNMIFSVDLMKAALSSMNYDANKMPLGNISKSTINQGFLRLKDLAEVLEAPTGPKSMQLGGFHQACNTLSAQYYTVIPHAFGRNRPEIIDSKLKLKKELELVDALGDMEVAQKLIDDSDHHKDANGDPINPLDGHFQSLNLKFMDPIIPTSDEHKKLQEYVTSTHGYTHSGFQSQILQAFRVERHDEDARWSADGYDSLADGERLLLWHGSRSTNFAGILKQGLRIAPPEAPVTGYMFGKGVYFADAMSKSANYCHAYSSNGIGIMLLCEVAAKPFFEQVHANYNAQVECAQSGKLATKGLGRTQPADWQDAGEVLNHDGLKGCLMPKGGLSNVDDGTAAYLQYNEYIVYQASQIKLRYLLMVKMH